MKAQRFIHTVSGGGVWVIRDTRRDEVVFVVHKGTRPMAHTEAMIRVVLDALNAAVAPRAPRTGEDAS